MFFTGKLGAIDHCHEILHQDIIARVVSMSFCILMTAKKFARIYKEKKYFNKPFDPTEKVLQYGIN